MIATKETTMSKTCRTIRRVRGHHCSEVVNSTVAMYPCDNRTDLVVPLWGKYEGQTMFVCPAHARQMGISQGEIDAALRRPPSSVGAREGS
jgi:hypothetical protein